MADAAGGAVLLYDKPAGVTSHDVVARVRRERGVKAGHAGTLDPFATGLVLILLGRATRLQRYLLGLPKTYIATARLGWLSSTGDPDGELEQTGQVPARLELPTGRISQRVPMTSAVRVGGERLYRKAHRGESIDTPEREVEVYRADLLETGGDRATFEIECSAGTYVRTLVEELGDAYCASLRRTAIGPLLVEQAGAEISPNAALAHLPGIELVEEDARRASSGQALAAPAELAGADRARLVFDGKLLAVARHVGDELRPETVLV